MLISRSDHHPPAALLQLDAARGDRVLYRNASCTGDSSLLGPDRMFCLDLAAPQALYCAGATISGAPLAAAAAPMLLEVPACGGGLRSTDDAPE